MRRVWITVSRQVNSDPEAFTQGFLTLEDDDENKIDRGVTIKIGADLYKILLKIFDIDEGRMTASFRESEKGGIDLFAEWCEPFERL
jgi:hypothetical protein